MNPLTIAPDMWKPHTWYALTINPDNSHQYLDDKDNRIEKVCTYIQNYHLIKLKDNADWILYTEISSPSEDNKKGVTRIHFHGKIRFTTPQGLLSWYMYIHNGLKTVSMVKMDVISEDEKWEQYSTKNKLIMQMLCNVCRIPRYLSDQQGRWGRLRQEIIEDEHLIKSNKKTILMDAVRSRKK